MDMQQLDDLVSKYLATTSLPELTFFTVEDTGWSGGCSWFPQGGYQGNPRRFDSFAEAELYVTDNPHYHEDSKTRIVQHVITKVTNDVGQVVTTTHTINYTYMHAMFNKGDRVFVLPLKIEATVIEQHTIYDGDHQYPGNVVVIYDDGIKGTTNAWQLKKLNTQ